MRSSISKDKIVDLELSEDGTYGTEMSKTKAVAKVKVVAKHIRNKHMIPSGADEFLSGLDVGLDFVEAMKSRAMRIIGLRD